MESNKVEARRAMDIAEMKLTVKDYVGAKKLANKAPNLDPDLAGLQQLLMMIDVYIFASKNGKGEDADWYGVLGVDPLADDEALKKRYKKLALLLHPDKNKCKGAEEAFKLVLEAWSLLSNHSKRIAYDQKRKSKPKPQESASSFNFWSQPVYSNKPNLSPNPSPSPSPNPDCSSTKGKEKVIDFVEAYFAKNYGLKTTLNNMEYNKEEARRAMDIAERKLSENDYVGAKKFVYKAHNLCPELEGLNQVLMMIHVYISASNGGREADWYGVLGVDPLADEETVKKQYKKLALLLHPDKNKFHGAEEAFKLVLEASCRLSDKAKRVSYDQTSRPREAKQRKREPKPQEQASPPKPQPKPRERSPPPMPKPKPNPNPNSSFVKEKVYTFWTMCNRCKTYYEYVREKHLDKTLPCQNCGQDFVAADIIPEVINGRPFIRMSSSFHSTRKSTSDTSSSTDSAKATHRRMKRWFEPEPEPNSSSEKKKASKYWTVCNRCRTYCRFVKASYLNKTLPCQNCGQYFVAAEIIPEIVDGSPVIR